MAEGGIQLASFGLDDVTACSDAIRAFAHGPGSMEEAAQGVVEHLRAALLDGDEPACALVRLYKTHPYGTLEPELQEVVRKALGEEPAPDVRSLTLLGSAGELPEWNDRRLSVGHRAIPLASEQMLAQLPMISRLVAELGVDPSAVVAQPEQDEAARLSQRIYGVFHVPEAAGSPYIPAQDFVERHGIASAVGFGGVLFTGDLYAVVLFSRVTIDARVAQRLKILSLAVRVPLIAFAAGRVFARGSGRGRPRADAPSGPR